MIYDNSFLKYKDRRYIIFGAGQGGVKCYKYLASLHLSNNVKFFIDNDINKKGNRLFDKEINILSDTKDKIFDDDIIIITTGYFLNIYEQLGCNGINNEIFVYTMFPEMFDEPVAHTFEEMCSCYENDDEATQHHINLALLIKNNIGICRIQPYEYVKILGDMDYWSGSKNSLKTFKELTICDVGAFDGDTIAYFFDAFGERMKKILAFEPDTESLKKLNENISKMQNKEVVQTYQLGLGNKKEKLTFSSGEGLLSKISENGNTTIDIDKLDNLDIEVIGKLCIKMDIEGAEIAALEGARETILKYKPELAICVYHKPDDICNIPRCIKDILPQYKCIIRGAFHMVCYASVDY